MAELFALESIDRDLYRGVNEVPENGRPTLYGGQVAAQALMAAGLTVPDGRFPHSMHGYFLRPGMRAQPVIFDLTASFHIDEPGGEYSSPMRSGVPAPEDCKREPFSHNFPNAEARVVPPTVRDENGNELSSTIWLKICEPLGDDRLMHSCALAYLSDIGTGFLSTEVPGLPKGGPSLDHAMWFRTPIRADEWVLHHMWPLQAGGARGLYAGSMHQQDGALGVTITQEALLRPAT
jgi:acyl-CoA thioesterase-2